MSKFSGGDGTAGNPFLISSVSDFLNIGSAGAYSHFLQTSDIDLQNVTDLMPIGHKEYNAFLYIYDGGGNTIENATISIDVSFGNPSAGLFHTMVNGSKISNLTIKNINIDISKPSVVGGILTPFARDIEGVSVQDSKIVNRGDFASGLAHQNYGTIKRTSVSCVVISKFPNSFVSGNYGIIEDCYSEGYVVGAEGNYSLIHTFSKGGDIRNCYTTASASLEKNEDAIFEIKTLWRVADETNLINSYEDVESKTSAIKWRADAEYYDKDALVRGTDGKLYECTEYYTTKVEGIVSPGVSGNWRDFYRLVQPYDRSTTRGTAQMKTKSNYVGWDFDKVWTIKEGEDYPRLRMVKICKSMGMPL